MMAPYDHPNRRTSTWQLITSLVPYFGGWYLAAVSMSYSYWLTLGCAILASGFFIRTFIIFHDCGHYAFFKSRASNEWIGTITGVLTFFPYFKWRYEHAVHHATSGDLERRGVGDIWTLTVKEYSGLSRFRRIVYRVYRNPFILFGLGPVYLFTHARFNRRKAGRKERWNTYLTNLLLIGLVGGLCFCVGWRIVLVVQGLILYVSGVIGVWLFYVQHQFDPSYYTEHKDWDYFDSALEGSSFYRLPKILQWITGNIGFHHVHHLGPRIPNYNLPKLHACLSRTQDVQQIDLRTSLRSLRYRLWDSDQKKFVGFHESRSVPFE